MYYTLVGMKKHVQNINHEVAESQIVFKFNTAKYKTNGRGRN